MQWDIEGTKYREATRAEIKELRAEPGAPHVTYGCKCGKGLWTAKNLTLSDDGCYVPIRNIFYNGSGPECECSASNLRCIVPV